ncbi:hypothetical protein D3C80_1978370 [compost metagenome]
MSQQLRIILRTSYVQHAIFKSQQKILQLGRLFYRMAGKGTQRIQHLRLERFIAELSSAETNHRERTRKLAICEQII